MSFYFDFDDLAPIEIPVKYAGATYLLREASEGATRQYRNAVMKTRIYSRGELVGLKDVADVESLLVSLCLFKTDPKGSILRNDKGDPINVHLDVISAWRGWMIRRLYLKALEISRLGEWEDSEDLEALERRATNDVTHIASVDAKRAKSLLSSLQKTLANGNAPSANGESLKDGEEAPIAAEGDAKN